MKKLTVFLTLLLCFCFSKMSAQAVLNWSVSAPQGQASLKIKIDGVVVVNVHVVQHSSQNGTLQVASNSVIEYEAQSYSAQLICAATETALVDGYLNGIYDFWSTYGYPPDPLTSYEYGSWTAYDDYDYTIQLSSIYYN